MVTVVTMFWRYKKDRHYRHNRHGKGGKRSAEVFQTVNGMFIVHILSSASVLSMCSVCEGCTCTRERKQRLRNEASQSANSRRLPHFCWLADKSAFALLLTRVTEIYYVRYRSQTRKFLLNDRASPLIEQNQNKLKRGEIP